MTLYGLEFLRSETEGWQKREERLSLERMHRNHKVIEECRTRQRNGEHVKLVRNVHGEENIEEY
jgi:hypothetical protein